MDSVSETKVTQENVSNGTRIIRNINITETIRKMSPRAKLLTGVYLSGLVSHQVLATYAVGKEALIIARQKGEQDEWKAVSQVCRSHTFSRFVDGLAWPTDIMGYVIPKLVIHLNPP